MYDYINTYIDTKYELLREGEKERKVSIFNKNNSIFKKMVYLIRLHLNFEVIELNLLLEYVCMKTC